MRITNELGLPSPLVEAVSNDGYDKGECDFSVTELIGPPRIAKLRKQHWKNLTEDASDRIFSLLGQSVHAILQRSASDKYLIEKRFFMEYEGVRISGQIDLYEISSQKIQDWKVTSYHTTSDGVKPEWVAQGNLLRLLMLENNYNVAALEFVAIFRDWSLIQAGNKPDYPQRQVEVLSLPMWPIKQAKEYLSERIRVHQAAEKELPLCTPEERWERPTRWALMKEGQKRAVKLFDSAETATEARTNPKQFVQERPGESVRCLYYCQVQSYCPYGRALIQEKAEAAA